VDLAKAYFKGLSESVKKHFNGNGVIASMQQCNDFFLLGTEAICLGRVGNFIITFDLYKCYIYLFLFLHIIHLQNNISSIFLK
jgi:TM2 domain-containing membrane protein YozV